MSVLLLAGQGFNLVEDANTITPSTAADALFPTSNLADRIPASIFKFGSLTAAPSIVFDLDRMEGAGDFENWSGGSPVGWTEANTGTGDVTQQSVSGILVHGGNFSARLAAGTGVASVFRDFVVRAGQRLDLRSWLLAGSGGSGLPHIRVRNQETGKFLNSGGAWQAGSIDAQVSTDHTQYIEFSTPFTVESMELCGGATATIRIQAINEDTTTECWVDDITLVPAVTFSSVHGHNIDPRSAPVLQSSPDNSAWTTRITYTVSKPSFYGTCAVQYLRYWKLLFADINGATSGAIWLGEFVLGDPLTLATGIMYPMSVGYRDYQVRVGMRWGDQAYGLGQAFTRSLPMTLQATSMTTRLEILRELFERSRGGHPLVIVPHDSNSHTEVIYGRLAIDLPHDWLTRSIAKITTSVEELPFPFVTS